MVLRLNVVFLFLTLSACVTFGQGEGTLAEEYYKAGEFEKAANEYGKLLKGDVTWTRLNRYVFSLQKANKADDAQKYLKKQQRSDELNRPYYEILMGQLANQQGDTTQAKQQFSAALQSSRSSVQRLEKTATAFVDAGENRWAIRALEMARGLAKDAAAYSEELSALYRATGQTEKSIEEIITMKVEMA